MIKKKDLKYKSFSTKIRTFYPDLPIFGLFFLLTVIITYPLIFKFSTSIYSLPGDAFSGLWLFWWQKYSFINALPANFSHLIGAPFGADLSSIIIPPTIRYGIFSLSLIFDEVVAYNFLSFLSFLLSAIFTYYLAKNLTNNRPASMIAAIIYAFSPFRLMKGHGSLGLMIAVQWLPLFLLALLKLRNKKNIWNILLVGVSFALVVLTDYYAGLFAIILAVVFLIVKLIFDFIKDKIFDRKFIAASFIALIVSISIIVPFILTIVKTSISTPKSLARPFQDVILYSARPWNYVLPSIENPFVGKYVKSYIEKRNLHQSNSVEQTLFLGYTPLFLAIVALYAWRKKRFDDQQDYNFAIPLLITVLFIAIWFSGPPALLIDKKLGMSIPMPSYYIYQIAPMFRVYARFGILAILSTALLASIGVTYLFQKNTATKKRNALIAAAIIVLISLEFTNVPPSQVTDLSASSMPNVYKWLKKQPGNFTIAEYPQFSLIEQATPGYLLFQRFHLKKMLNGSIPGSESDKIRIEAINDFSDPNTHKVLKYLGVKYAIIHWDQYPKKQKPFINNSLNTIKLVKKFNDNSIFTNTLVYEIKAKPASIFFNYGKYFYLYERWSDKNIWRWTVNNAELNIKNLRKDKTKINLKFSAVSFNVPRKVKIIINKKMIKTIVVYPSKKAFFLKRIVVNPGDNIVYFRASPPQTKIGPLIGNDDKRLVSVGFSSFRMLEIKD